MNKILLITAISVLLISCDKNPTGYKYHQGVLPNLPVNLENFNTIYDDYNSTAPSFGDLIPFCFSTNRNSNGNEFDVIYQPMNVNFDKSSGNLTVTNEYGNWNSISDRYHVIQNNINKINTSGNEFGPYLIPEYDFNDLYFTLLYASDVTGDFQINYISNHTETNFSAPKEVTFLNSEFDDLYPCFNSDNSQIYFCSNRDDDNFDFYSVHVDPDPDPEIDIESILSDNSSHEIIKDNTLSSISDDKCPFIFENKIVFASNRDGGFGGFDLYSSFLKDGVWSKPVNLGSNINTEFNEYRPILINEGVSENQTMMVFSSNRTGGKGGFDLYFVGLVIE
ncbi:TolB family protein [Ancylomarina sp. YFZ004]